MAFEAYLKIGDIPGESQRVDHEEEIDIHDMRWGVERSMPASIGRGRRARSRADIKPLVLHKYFDAASSYLALAVNQGKRFREVVLAVRKDSGEAHLDYLVITMENVVLTSYQVASNREDLSDMLLEEEIEIDFERATLTYRMLNDDGSAGTVHEVELSG